MPQSRRARAMLVARIILMAQLVPLAVLTPVLFYLQGFSSQPHHVMRASLVTSVYFVLAGGAAWWVHRVKKAQANRLSDTEPWNGLRP